MLKNTGLYAQKIKTLLSPEERRLFQKLSTPHKTQDYLDVLPINFQEGGEGICSPRVMLQKKKVQCMEGALFAATSLAYHGYAPLLMDFQTIAEDEDHVVALFKENNLWGAISKTNHAILRWRDPIYKTPRELAMSYFHEYYMHSGQKSLLTFSRPFDLSKYPPERWATAQEELEWLAAELDESPHFPIVAKKVLQRLRYVSPLERKLLDVVEWEDPRKKKVGK